MKIQQKKSECNGCCRRKEGFKPKTDNVEIVIFRGISEGGKGSSVGDNKMNVNNDKNNKKNIEGKDEKKTKEELTGQSEEQNKSGEKKLGEEGKQGKEDTDKGKKENELNELIQEQKQEDETTPKIEGEDKPKKKKKNKLKKSKNATEEQPEKHDEEEPKDDNKVYNKLVKDITTGLTEDKKPEDINDEEIKEEKKEKIFIQPPVIAHDSELPRRTFEERNNARLVSSPNDFDFEEEEEEEEEEEIKEVKESKKSKSKLRGKKILTPQENQEEDNEIILNDIVIIEEKQKKEAPEVYKNLVKNLAKGLNLMQFHVDLLLKKKNKKKEKIEDSTEIGITYGKLEENPIGENKEIKPGDIIVEEEPKDSIKEENLKINEIKNEEMQINENKQQYDNKAYNINEPQTTKEKLPIKKKKRKKKKKKKKKKIEPEETNNLIINNEYITFGAKKIFPVKDNTIQCVVNIKKRENAVFYSIDKEIFNDLFNNNYKIIINERNFYYERYIIAIAKIINDKQKGEEYYITSGVNNYGDFSSFFCSLKSTREIKILKSNGIINLKYMFSKCTKLTKINISNLVTSNVTNMNGMFSECSKLTSLDLSNFNTTNVTDMNNMFRGCSALQELNLESFNTNNVTNMRGMFTGCTSLKKLDITYNKENNYKLEEQINKINNSY